MKKILLLATLGFLLPSHSTWATQFTNQFVEFELPLKWNCALEGAEWVCQNTDEGHKRDAIIVLAAKLKGDQDNLEKYEEYLNKPRTFAAPNGKQVSSQPKYHRVTQINGQPWVDSLHLESEIPGFYTRYLATIKQDIAVLVTYSINKTKYQDYQSQFDDMVKSIRVFRKPGGMLAKSTGSIFNSTQSLGTYTQQGLFAPEASAAPAAATAVAKTKKQESDDFMLLLLLAAAIGGYLYMRKKRANGGGGTPPV